MKVLTLTQPWATLMAIGAKRIETRGWSTSYRGPLAIHAAKKFPQDCVSLCFDSPFKETLVAAGIIKPRELPLGQVLAVLELVNCLKTNWLLRSLDDAAYHLRRELFDGTNEEAFGDYSDGRFGFVTRGLRRLDEPFTAKGALGLWELDDPRLEALR